MQFQHTAARRRLLHHLQPSQIQHFVSTHSRPKAAARLLRNIYGHKHCFNTQPPEGGCVVFLLVHHQSLMFQHTAARRRLPVDVSEDPKHIKVSTHSRPKAAASLRLTGSVVLKMFQHTAARRRLPHGRQHGFVDQQFQHTAARRRLQTLITILLLNLMFQHTAARRRLHCNCLMSSKLSAVSTHSRPKAAACLICQKQICLILFQHTAARRRLPFTPREISQILILFQHTAARRRLQSNHCH